MNLEAPPRLLELVTRSLFSNEALDLSSLQDLPMGFFLLVFLEAFKGGHTHVLKSMVQAWPFPSLPLGSLMKTSHLETLQIFLDGLDMLLDMKDRPREWKLQVLNLQTGDENLWKMGCGHIARACSELPRGFQTGSPASWMGKRKLRIFTDLCIMSVHGALHDFQAYLLDWVEMRKEVVELWCRKLKIWSNSMYIVKRFLCVVRLESIEQLVVDSFFDEANMDRFVSSVGKMSNLQIFSFQYMSVATPMSRWDQRWYSHMYAAHLQKMDNLQEIYVHDVFFLKGQLHKILRRHTPLVTLSLKCSPLTEADLKHLSECRSTGQLKHLTLTNIDMTNFSPQPLRALLEKVAGTLETLTLELCNMNDSHIIHTLPALDSCSHLTTLSCYGNHMSMSVLENLLSRTARLSHLHQVLYPMPSTFEEGCWCVFNEEQFHDVFFQLEAGSDGPKVKI